MALSSRKSLLFRLIWTALSARINLCVVYMCRNTLYLSITFLSGTYMCNNDIAMFKCSRQVIVCQIKSVHFYWLRGSTVLAQYFSEIEQFLIPKFLLYQKFLQLSMVLTFGLEDFGLFFFLLRATSSNIFNL